MRISKLKHYYEKEYKKLLIIPFILLLLAILQVGYQLSTTGDFVKKGISLKGGMSITIPTEEKIDIQGLKTELSSTFPNADITVRKLTQAGRITGFIVESDIDINDKEKVDNVANTVIKETGLNLTPDDYSIEGIGSSLGQSFFREAFIAIIIAFLFMGFVVFLYFRTIVPSLAVILAAFSDMIITLAAVNLLGVKLSTAGIAAFLMLIGYSVDTDVLLSTKVLKRKEGTAMERIYSSIKTGLTMNFSTMAAVILALIITDSEVISQIMLIIFIGLLADLVNTWIQNVGLLRMHLERKRK